MIHKRIAADNINNLMPIYEFKCNDCGHEFDLVESFKEHDEHKEKCPKCKSDDIEQVLSAVSVKTSNKS